MEEHDFCVEYFNEDGENTSGCYIKAVNAFVAVAAANVSYPVGQSVASISVYREVDGTEFWQPEIAIHMVCNVGPLIH